MRCEGKSREGQLKNQVWRFLTSFFESFSSRSGLGPSALGHPRLNPRNRGRSSATGASQIRTRDRTYPRSTPPPSAGFVIISNAKLAGPTVKEFGLAEMTVENMLPRSPKLGERGNVHRGSHFIIFQKQKDSERRCSGVSCLRTGFSYWEIDK